MSSSESWALEKLAELTTALVGRFGEEAAIQTSFKNLVTLEQSKNNKLQLDLLALQSKYDLLSNKLFIKKWVQDRFMRVVLKAEEETRHNHRLDCHRLQTAHEEALEDVDNYKRELVNMKALYEMKMEEVKASCDRKLAMEVAAHTMFNDELRQQLARVKTAYEENKSEAQLLRTQIDDLVVAHEDKLAAELAKCATIYTEKLAEDALDLHAHFDTKLVKELSAVADVADMKHSEELVGVEAAYEDKLIKAHKSFDDLRSQYSIFNPKYCNLVTNNALRGQHVGNAGVSSTMLSSSPPCPRVGIAVVHGDVVLPSTNITTATNKGGVNTSYEGSVSALSAALDKVKKDLTLEEEEPSNCRGSVEILQGRSCQTS